MKRIMLVGILLSAMRMQGQELWVCYDKTVNLIFPYAIRSEDHGSAGIIVQQRKGADHILHVKANQKNFQPTSLSVLTSDGRLYSFVVGYTEDAFRLTYLIDSGEAVAVTEVPHNQRILQGESETLMKSVRGVYISQNALWVKMNFRNRWRIPFDIGFIKFFIADKRRAKNAAVQEREIFPVYQLTPQNIAGRTKRALLFAFDPFVLRKAERFVIQLADNGHSRLVRSRIKARQFRRTSMLP